MFWFWVEIVYFFPYINIHKPKKKKKEGLKFIWHPKALIVNTWNKTKNQTKHTKKFIWIFWKTTLKTQSLLPISSIDNNSHKHNSNKKYVHTHLDSHWFLLREICQGIFGTMRNQSEGQKHSTWNWNQSQTIL